VAIPSGLGERVRPRDGFDKMEPVLTFRTSGWVCDIEVDEREAQSEPRPGYPLGPALPGVRSTPGFSRLAGVYVNRLTFMSHTPSGFDRSGVLQ
jgi:hypothetical protein